MNDEIIDNPVTGERFRWHVTEAESHGKLVRAEAWTRPGGGVFVEHLHPDSEERFEVLQGRMVLEVDGEQRVLLPGERDRVPPGVPHRWRSAGEEELHMFVEISNPRGFESMIEDVFAAARAGEVDDRGRLKLLTAARLMRRHHANTRATVPPRPLQSVLLPPLALLARLLGRPRRAPRAAAGAIVAGLAVAVLALAAIAAPPARAFTVVEHETASGAERLQVSCGEEASYSLELPAAATSIEVIEPQAGDPILDGFGDRQLATVVSAEVQRDGSGVRIVAGAVGSGRACESPGLSWETGPAEIRARYDIVSHPRLLVSDDQAGMHAREEPRSLTANADAGWRRLAWKGWGGRTTTARGVFSAIRWIPIGHSDVEPRRFSYPVEVTLSRVRRCGSEHWMYSRIETRFLRHTPAEVRRQAVPPGTASCLDAAH